MKTKISDSNSIFVPDERAVDLILIVHALILSSQVAWILEVDPMAAVVVDVWKSCFHDHMSGDDGEDCEVEELDEVFWGFEAHFELL